MVRWYHSLDGHEFEQAPGVGDGQESLECCSPWGPDKNTGAGGHALLQGIFLTQGSNPASCVFALQADALLSEPPGKPSLRLFDGKIRP